MKQYFYIDSNKQQIGPLAEDALMVLVRCGAIYRQTLIWTEGLTDWMPFGIVFPECAAETLPPPPPPTVVDDLTAEPDFPMNEELMEKLRPLRKYRKIFIIGGIVAIIVAIFHPACIIFSIIRDSSSPSAAVAWNNRRDAAASTEYESLNAIEEECDEEQEQERERELLEQLIGTHCWYCNGTGVTHTANKQYEIICPRCQGAGRVRK